MIERDGGGIYGSLGSGKAGYEPDAEMHCKAWLQL